MVTYDITRWVERDPDPRIKQFREAVHIVLFAISSSQHLNSRMIMKGGVLLAIRYKSSRHTRDIDFSTSLKALEFDKTAFISEFNDHLTIASESLPYGLACKIQSYKFNPPNSGATFPTFIVRVGYADKSDFRKFRRLMVNNSSDVVQIDYSFNEITQKTDILKLTDGGEISVYSFVDLVAEKYRAILQQEMRNRFRRQDIYDLFFLLSKYSATDVEKRQILKSLRIKSHSRDLEIDEKSILNDEIIRRSKENYHLLEQEIEEKLPPFEKAYRCIQRFYELLPWNDPSSGIKGCTRTWG